jgi:hypothetical protein
MPSAQARLDGGAWRAVPVAGEGGPLEQPVLGDQRVELLVG